MLRDRRSPEAAAYRSLYKTARWQRARESQLSRKPLCEMCEEEGRVEPATVVNHRKAHKGDEQLFWDPANYQSLCKRHHDSDAQIIDKGGQARPAIGEDGWPVGR